MTSSLPSTPPLAILQADHSGKITSASLLAMESDAEHNLLHQWFTEIISPFFPLKTIMTEQNLWSWSRDKSPPSPQIADFSD